MIEADGLFLKKQMLISTSSLGKCMSVVPGVRVERQGRTTRTVYALNSVVLRHFGFFRDFSTTMFWSLQGRLQV